jgi:acetyl esterase/lipase
LTGRFSQLLKNPGHVTSWLADTKGQVRFGIQWERGGSRLIYRDDPEKPWQTSTELGGGNHERWLIGLDASERVLHVGQASANGRRGIFAYDLGRQEMVGALFEHEQYDVVMPDFTPHFAGVALATPVYSHKSRQLLGVRYVTTVPQRYWFDPAMTELQRQIDAMHPELLNTIVNMDAAENRLLVLSWSDREPGIYSLVDLATQKVTPIGRRMPWIKPEEMAPMYPIECRARDGLPLCGYLTLPVGAGRRNLPAVVLVHGGPWVRDVWGFDTLVQFLANRGYAVLQINFRGSAGYGADFSAKGREQVGGTIQDDIADATRWLVAQHFADPQRIAIMGGSFGGYSVLHALAKSPELYRCGVAYAAVTDWPDLLAKREKGEYLLVHEYWRRQIGDLKDEAVRRRMTEVSPVSFADQIRLPLLLVHGEEDQVVPIKQAKRFADSLAKLGRPPDTLYLKRVGHEFPVDKPAREFLTRLESFLARHLGPP